jgi:hypothetical protein
MYAQKLQQQLMRIIPLALTVTEHFGIILDDQIKTSFTAKWLFAFFFALRFRYAFVLPERGWQALNICQHLYNGSTPMTANDSNHRPHRSSGVQGSLSFRSTASQVSQAEIMANVCNLVPHTDLYDNASRHSRNCRFRNFEQGWRRWRERAEIT